MSEQETNREMSRERGGIWAGFRETRFGTWWGRARWRTRGLLAVTILGAGSVVGVVGKTTWDHFYPAPVTREAEGFVPDPTATLVPVEITATPEVAATATPISEVTAIATVTPKPAVTEVAGGIENVGNFQGVPERINAADVLIADGADGYGNVFTNTIKLGSEMIIAEPGVLKVECWRFPPEQLEQFGQSALCFDSGNHYVLHTKEDSLLVPEGAFSMLNGNAMSVGITGTGSTRFHLEIGGPVGNHNIVVIRGLFGDNSTPADRNRVARVTNHTSGAVVGDMYPRGSFVSQGQFEQIVENALVNNPNCGDEGCGTVRAYFLDLNTGAFAGMGKSGNGPWRSIFDRNW
ncbi:hypothetical protein KKE78_00560 [Patescibacteria group bacterium]|nr:hypothetical protein [Patescibacteria group bacterium]